MLKEECCKWCNKLYMIFIDFENVLDSLDCQSFWNLLHHYGILNIIQYKFVLRSINSTGLSPNDCLLSDLDFADDIAIFKTCKSQLQALLMSVQQKAEGFGLNTNTSKTKGMATSNSPLNIKCNDKDVEQVVHFKYLGSTIKNTGSTATEVIACDWFQQGRVCLTF
ncbi:uncharacterized protein LOC136025756 [Artemia franciscana]|uniref:uncharacterized protein LOC136025756 n=1 Tax=Artemia franciscana TaxID=6661 RepID=UPI0032DB7F7E